MDNTQYEHIPQEMFEFQQINEKIHDKKLETKSRGYFADAMIRFKKNKSSVVAAWILLLLVLFSIVSPMVSGNDIYHMDQLYKNYPPFVKSVADMKIGILDGSTSDDANELEMQKLKGIAEETGMDPVIEVVNKTSQWERKRGQWIEKFFYEIKINKYYELGVDYRTLSYDEYKQIQKFQNETNIQVLYPYVEPADIEGIKDNPNIWYKVSDTKGNAILDKDGNFIPAYSTNAEKADIVPYKSTRIESDPGNYIYCYEKSGSVHVRVLYYNYYQYEHWKATGEPQEPTYIFGTNTLGQCIFTGIGVGARFSLIFALIVSAINLTIGAIYGAIQGYYGGTTDMVMDRFADILGGVPFIVVATLFKLHLSQKVPMVVSFAFAFILTGWLGMAGLTRKQFYRFKNQEFVLAARTLGASDWRLMFKHIFPNSLGTIITSCALVIPGVINSEVSMTYLGVINLQTTFGTTIGTLAEQGQGAMMSAPHAMLFPALFLSLLLISFNLFGNGLRDAFNPATRGVED